MHSCTERERADTKASTQSLSAAKHLLLLFIGHVFSFEYSTAIPFALAFHSSMATRDDSASADESNPSKEKRTSSITECLSMGPIAAASRLMSSLSKQTRASLPTELNSNTVPSSPLLESISERPLPPVRNRSFSPKSPSSQPLIHVSTPFVRSSATTPSGLNRAPALNTPVEPLIPTPETVDLNFNFDFIHVQLRDLAETNCQYFAQQRTDVCRRFECLLIQILHSLELSVPLIRYLTENFEHFDYSPEVSERVALGQSEHLIAFAARYAPMAIERWLSRMVKRA